jgi:membrane protein
MTRLLGPLWLVARETVANFVADEALSRGAAIAYYTLFAMAPILLVGFAIAGMAFGEDAARGAIVNEFAALMGTQTAEAMQAVIKGASDPKTGAFASILGIGAALITLTGVFGEVQASLNAIWKVTSNRSVLTRLMRARLASLGLVVTSGFLLSVSLVVSAALAAASIYLKAVFPAAAITLQIVDVVASLLLISLLFAAIFKVLPDTPIGWRDVAVGAFVTAVLFEGGKYLIALYIGQSNIASTYGTAGALVVLLVWIYYSAQIFLFGAEFTHAYAKLYGTRSAAGQPISPTLSRRGRRRRDEDRLPPGDRPSLP